MRRGDIEAVVDHGERVEQVVEECSSIGLASSGGELDADTEFGDGDRGNGRFIAVGDQAVEIEPTAFGSDEHVRVKQQGSQNRSSATSCDRSSATSPIHSASTRWWRISCFARAPEVVRAGSSWAMTLPRRTIVNVSPRCSTASSRSAKRRDASVALTSGIESDYLITAETATSRQCVELPGPA